ncbi:hypothetical protein CIRG_04221 [Coccidioides immitis RMSCC 2394]|uniref:NDT80 domain-containing protein n=1 Tax=Coccidioides immitis RMSCC 2394 TaxID=404692 RepID=A0A0J6Y9Y1_COCIT|nr:hypothetical protein CIRG_04221 [Coccidioides immitis RMSCC 2394]
MSAQLHGMFFLAESPWTTSPTSDTNIPPPVAELTCYRRNLFQITGSVTLPRGLRYILTEHGDRIPILAHELTVSATESVEGNSVKIISVPWKTPATNTTGQPEDKTEKEPPSIPLDTMTGQDLDSDYATFSIAWKRLQFRIATANNGRRKELQQHFVVRLKIVATLSTGTKVPIAEAHSGPVIVRGRSPRNFQSRKDLPLSGSAAASRKNAQAAALHRANTADAARSHQAAAKRSKSPQGPTPAPVPLKLDTDAKPSSPQQQPPPSATLPDWTHVTSAPTSTTPFSAPPVTGPTAASAAYAKSSPEQPRPGKRRRTSASTKPISLSLADDVPSPATPTTPHKQQPLEENLLAWDTDRGIMILPLDSFSDIHFSFLRRSRRAIAWIYITLSFLSPLSLSPSSLSFSLFPIPRSPRVSPTYDPHECIIILISVLLYIHGCM